MNGRSGLIHLHMIPLKFLFSVCRQTCRAPALSPLPISLMFFSHNKSGPDFLKQTMLWGLSPPITLCQFQSGLKYDSTVCASPCLKCSPPPPFPLYSAILFLGLAISYSSFLPIQSSLCNYDYE